MTIEAGLLPHTITIITPAEVEDAYGNTVLTYDPELGATTRTAAAYVRPFGGIQGSSATEVTVDRDAVTAAWQVHTNDANVTALNRITYDGVAHEVDGKPNVWVTDPRGRPGHTKLLIRRVDG